MYAQVRERKTDCGVYHCCLSYHSKKKHHIIYFKSHAIKFSFKSKVTCFNHKSLKVVKE